MTWQTAWPWSPVRRGIGQAIADLLADNGAHVYYSDVDAAEVQRAAAGRTGCTAVTMDVCNDEQVQAVTDRIVREHGRVDILINNAGVNTMQHRVPIDHFPREEWDRILQIDLTGLYVVSRTVSGVMRAAEAGAHRQYRFDCRPGPAATAMCFCGRQGRGHQSDQSHGARTGC